MKAVATPSWIQRVVSAGLIAVFVYAVFIGGTLPGTTLAGFRLLSGVIAFVVLMGWLVVALVRPAWRPSGGILLPILVAFLVFCLAALFSERPRLSQDAILQAAGLVLAFLFLCRLAADPFYRTRLIGVVVGVTIVIVAAYSVHVLVSWGIWWSSVGHLAPPPLRPPPELIAVLSPALEIVLTRLNLGLVNLTAAICLLAMPFAVAVVAARSRALALFLAGIGIFVLIASASRGALLGAAFALAAGLVLVALTFFQDRMGRGTTRVAWDRRVVAGGAAILVVAVALGLVLLPSLSARFTGGIDSARLSLYEATVRLIEAHPILGNGPGTWSILHSAYNSVGSTNIVQHHAHDTLLQTLSDVGIVGAIACAWVLVVVVLALFRRFRATAGAERMMIGAIIVGLAGALGHSIFDHFLNLATYALILGALVAIGIEDPQLTATSLPRPGRVARASGVAVLVAVIAGVLLVEPTVLTHARAEAAAAEARAAGDRGDWASAGRSAQEAVTLDPDLPLYRIELGLALAHLGRPEAGAIIEQAATEDSLPHLQLSAASLALADGDVASALAAVILAESRTTGEVAVDINAGDVARAAGRTDLAIRWWGAAVALNTVLADSTYFKDPSRSALLPAVLAEARARLSAAGDPISPLLLMAYSGAPDDAMAALRALPASSARDTAIAEVVWFRGRQSEAVESLKGVVANDPMAQAALADLTQYCIALGDQACVHRYRPLLLAASGAEYASAPNDGSTIPAPLDQRGRGTPSVYPAAVYLQDGYRDMLAPGVLVVGTP